MSDLCRRCETVYEYRNPYVVDFSNVKYYSEIHEILADAFDFPDYYGKNWSALWDCLTDLMGRETNVEIYGLQVIRDKFGDTADKLIEILKDWKHCDNDECADEIHIYITDGKSEVELV